MRIAISIPDDVYVEAEELTRRLNISRSELSATALREYLARHDPESITAALNSVYGDGQNEPDPAILAGGVETLKRVGW